MESRLVVQRIVVAPYMENVYIVGDSAARTCIVIDPGAQGERIVDRVERQGFQLSRIVCTHGHIDHVGGVAVVKEATGAPFAMNPMDIALLEQNEESGRLKIPGFRPCPEPDLLLRGGDEVLVGDLRFKVMETPGHTRGSVCLYGHGVLFSGDTLFAGSVGRFDGQGGDGQQLIESIFRELVPLPDETAVYPGHGPQTTMGREKRTNPFLQPGRKPF